MHRLEKLLVGGMISAVDYLIAFLKLSSKKHVLEKKKIQLHAWGKIQIIKRHFVDKIHVSDLCNEYNLQPTVCYSI